MAGPPGLVVGCVVGALFFIAIAEVWVVCAQAIIKGLPVCCNLGFTCSLLGRRLGVTLMSVMFHAVVLPLALLLIFVAAVCDAAGRQVGALLGAGLCAAPVGVQRLAWWGESSLRGRRHYLSARGCFPWWTEAHGDAWASHHVRQVRSCTRRCGYGDEGLCEVCGAGNTRNKCATLVFRVPALLCMVLGYNMALQPAVMATAFVGGTACAVSTAFGFVAQLCSAPFYNGRLYGIAPAAAEAAGIRVGCGVGTLLATALLAVPGAAVLCVAGVDVWVGGCKLRRSTLALRLLESAACVLDLAAQGHGAWAVQTRDPSPFALAAALQGRARDARAQADRARVVEAEPVWPALGDPAVDAAGGGLQRGQGGGEYPSLFSINPLQAAEEGAPPPGDSAQGGGYPDLTRGGYPDLTSGGYPPTFTGGYPMMMMGLPPPPLPPPEPVYPDCPICCAVPLHPAVAVALCDGGHTACLRCAVQTLRLCLCEAWLVRGAARLLECPLGDAGTASGGGRALARGMSVRGLSSRVLGGASTGAGGGGARACSLSLAVVEDVVSRCTRAEGAAQGGFGLDEPGVRTMLEALGPGWGAPGSEDRPLSGVELSRLRDMSALSGVAYVALVGDGVPPGIHARGDKVFTCPGPGCGHLMAAYSLSAKPLTGPPGGAGYTESAASAKCITCATLACRECQQPWTGAHSGRTCEALRMLTSMGKSEALLVKGLGASFKQCPGCGTGISHYRAHGCHHIRPGAGCPSCGAHFCYVCLHLHPRGGPYHCPNSCKLFCDSTGECGCLDCPECKPGQPCSECDACRSSGRPDSCKPGIPCARCRAEKVCRSCGDVETAEAKEARNAREAEAKAKAEALRGARVMETGAGNAVPAVPPVVAAAVVDAERWAERGTARTLALAACGAVQAAAPCLRLVSPPGTVPEDDHAWQIAPDTLGQVTGLRGWTGELTLESRAATCVCVREDAAWLAELRSMGRPHALAVPVPLA